MRNKLYNSLKLYKNRCVTSRLTLSAPATIAVLAGSGAESSLFNVPPGITVSGPGGTGAVTLQLAAANSTATLAVSTAGGGTQTGSGAHLTITGTAAQVNAALATLQDDETGSQSSDVLLLTATEPGLLYTQAAIGVDIYPTIGPAFVTPPTIVNIAANKLDSIPLLLADPEATGLAAIGAGQTDTLSLTLSVTAGLLLLGDRLGLAGVEVNGEASEALSLTFTADALGAVNTLLGSLDYVGPDGKIGLAYVARNISGPVATTLTHGIVTLTVTGTTSPTGTLSAGDETIRLAPASLTGSVLTGTNGGLAALTASGIVVAPDAGLDLPASGLSLSGSNLDFGAITATTLVQSGALLVADGLTLAGPLSMAAGAVTDFTGSFVAGNAALYADQLAISLGAGADLAGGGVLTAGNFSESGLITGPGTITALTGQTLSLVAGSITGGVVLQVDSGAVMVVGPLSPLYGVFDAAPISISNSVILDFNGTAAVDHVSGIYGNSLDETGGVFVIWGPENFQGMIENFQPGDGLIFPGLSDGNITTLQGSGSFEVQGINSYGTTATYKLLLASPSNPALFNAKDAEGDYEVLARAAVPAVNLPPGGLSAGTNTPQPILGLSLDLVQATTASLSLTLSVENGVLSEAGMAARQVQTFSASNASAIDALLAGLTYTGNGTGDELTITGSGVLAGLNDGVVIATPAGIYVNGENGNEEAESQIATFAANAGLVAMPQALAPGRAWVMGGIDFAGLMEAAGVAGVALQVDTGGTAVFDGSAAAAFGGDLVVGDSRGAGTLAVITPYFTTTGNVTIGGNAAAGGSVAEIFGSLGAGGSLAIGGAASGALNLAGSLSAVAVSIGNGGTLFAYGSAAASLGSLTDAGAVTLLNNAAFAAAGLSLTGTLAVGGAAAFDDSGTIAMSGGVLTIGQDAAMQASALTESGGLILDAGTLAVSGSVVLGNVSLSGGTLIAGTLGTGASFTVSGHGIFAANASLPANGEIIASGGLLVVDAPLGNAGLIQIDAGATLDVVSTLASEQISFAGANAVLISNDPALLQGEISGLAVTDGIDLRGVAPGNVDYLNHQVTVYDTLQNQLTQFLIYNAAGQVAPEISSDGQDGTLITLGAELPCFARGTRLLTPHGYRAVELFAPGDPVVTATGARRAVRWIGRRTIDLGRQTGIDAYPVVISAGAFGPAKPARAVKLSPLHAVYAQGVLVPALHLVNGATITQEKKPAAVTYYHIELERHDLLLAEGLPCESYFDAGNRGALYQEWGIRTPARHPYARLVTSGPKLAKIRQRLHDIALGLGFSLTYQPRLRLAAPGVAAVPALSMRGGSRVASFAVPLPPGEVVLLSQTASPADTDPFSEDRRELGVCLAEAGQVQLGAGWLPRAPHDNGIWMGAQAGLHMSAPADGLTLTLAAIVQTWVPPGTAQL